MRVRLGWAICWALAFGAPILGGCLSNAPERNVAPPTLGIEPLPAVQSVLRLPLTVASADTTSIAALVYLPQTTETRTDGSAVRWPVVLFLHGWAGGKEDYEGSPAAGPGLAAADPTAGVNRLEQFARAGFIAVAYDARGFGGSGGQTTVAGPAEMQDLDAVLDAVEAKFPTNGKVGVTGQSYGAGESLLAWAHDSRVDAVAARYGWTDLYDGLVPGNVPKLEWAQALYLAGLPSSNVHYSAMIHRWYQDIYTRSDFDTMRVEMAARGIGADGSKTPLLLCQGMQETLFPQVDRAFASANAHGAFVRAAVYRGGHGSQWDPCWQRTVDWFRFFLAGVDTHVDSWPVLETVDAVGNGIANSTAWPQATVEPRWLRLAGPGQLVLTPVESAFTVTQSLLSNPLAEPAGLSDRMGQAAMAVPEDLRQDPNAVVFTTPPFDGPRTILGTPRLVLSLANDTGAPFQATAQLQRVAADGSTQVLAHAAFAALDGQDILAGNVTLEFAWLKATLQKGDALRLVVASNDESWYMPLAAPYSVRFDGLHRLDVPILPVPVRPGVE